MPEPGHVDNHARRHPDPSAVSAAMQDYLKAIHRLHEDDDTVTTLNLAGELGLSAASATNMIKRLAELGLVEHTRYHGVRMTPTGERVALEVIRHHRLLELYLAEAMGFEWDKVHDEAERLEHHVSTEFEHRMDELLGHPEFDPHGDPIPSPHGTVPTTPWVRLWDLHAGQRAALRRVSDRDSQHLRFLSEIGLVPGTEIVVVACDDIDQGCQVRLGVTAHTIPEALAKSLQVEPLR